MKVNLTVPNLSCHELASKLCDIQKAADAAAAPYKGPLSRTDEESILPYVLDKDELLREMLLAQSSEMLTFIWELLQLGKRDFIQFGETLMKIGYQCSQSAFTNSGKSLMFLEFYFKDQQQKRARKDKRSLLQKIIKTPYLNICLRAGIITAEEEDLIDADLSDSLFSVGLVAYG